LKDLTWDKFRALCNGIAKNESLQELELWQQSGDHVVPDPQFADAKHLARAVTRISKLRKLTICGYGFYEELHVKAICEGLYKCRSLTYFDCSAPYGQATDILDRSDFEKPGIYLNEMNLSVLLASIPRIEKLVLMGAMFFVEVTDGQHQIEGYELSYPMSFHLVPHLEDLDLGCNLFDGKDWDYVLRPLAACTKLKHLNLSTFADWYECDGEGFDTLQARSIAGFLINIASLRRFNISYQVPEYETLVQFLSELQEHHQLEEVCIPCEDLFYQKFGNFAEAAENVVTSMCRFNIVRDWNTFR